MAYEIRCTVESGSVHATQTINSTSLHRIQHRMFVDWFVPVYLLVSVLVLAGFGACLYFLEPGLQDAHKWSNKSIKHQPLVPTLKTHLDDDSSALI